MNEKKHLDFISSIVLIIFSGAVILGSIQMYQKAGEVIYLSPALMPLILGIALFGCSIVNLLGSVKGSSFKGQWNEFTGWLRTAVKEPTTKAMLMGTLIMAVYVFVLMSFLPFWISSIIFICVLMFYMKAAKPVRIAMLALGSVGLIVLLFQVLFRVPLP